MIDIDRSAINQFLTFTLANEEYAINVANIKEVLGVPRITRVPRMPDYMSGIINLRGNVVPVLDLRHKFGLGVTPVTIDTGIIVTEIENIFSDDEEEGYTIGIFSDMVHQVVTFGEADIEPPPKIGVSIDTSFILGMGRLGEGFVMILDINKLLSEKELLSERPVEVYDNE